MFHCSVSIDRNVRYYIYIYINEQEEYRISSIYTIDQSTGGTFPSTQLLVGVMSSSDEYQVHSILSFGFFSLLYRFINEYSFGSIFFPLSLLFINR